MYVNVTKDCGQLSIIDLQQQMPNMALLKLCLVIVNCCYDTEFKYMSELGGICVIE